MGEALAHETSTETVKKPSNTRRGLDDFEKAAKKTRLFRTLGTKRVNSAMKRIALIGNLSNKSSYAYSDGDIKKLVSTLRNAIDRMEARFTPSSKDTDSFSF